MFVGMVVGGRGAPRCDQPFGRRSRFDPCTPGWFGVGRLACCLFTVKWRLQLWCCWFAVVLAASWSAWFAWVPLRCCRWSFRRTLSMQLACPYRCWSVRSWFVQGYCCVVCYRWLVAFVLAALWCSAVFVGMVLVGRGAPLCHQPFGRRFRFDRARLAGLVLAGLRVVCLRSSGGCSCGVVGSRSSWQPHGRLVLRGFHCSAAGGCSAACCLCSWHVRVGAG